MSLGKRRRKILDGKRLFDRYYLVMDNGRSLPKLAKWATAEWGRNPETGREWTNGAVWQSIWRWALDNLDYAKSVYKKVSLDFFLNVEKVYNPNKVWSDDEFEDDWCTTVARHAHTCMTKTQYRRFLNKYPEFQPYEVVK